MAKTPRRTPCKKTATKLREPVEVYCRIRPLEDVDDDNCVDVVSDSTIQLNPPKNSKASERGRFEAIKCVFKRVFNDEVQQEEIFEQTALPLVDDLISGRSGLLFMYGITGSGKTYTMNGTPSDGGILPRCLDVLFNSIGHVQTQKHIFKPDNYNRYFLQSDTDAKCERDRRLKENLLLTPRTPRNNSKKRVIIDTRKEELDTVDMARIPDKTQFQVDEDNVYAVFISYVEIYNNFIYDLLDETPIDPICPKPPISKIIREDIDRNMYVYGATEVEVKSTEEAFDAFWKGQRRRRVAHTQLNAESSRSHSVFQIRLVQAPLDSSGTHIFQDKKQIAISNLSLCDLAGSERTNRTNSEGDRLREAGNINASLMTLRTCIEVLRENQKAAEIDGTLKIVPYRDTKLTNLFRTFFEGEGKVRMVVCLNPKAEDFDESLHVMRFAEATQEVKTAKSEGVRFDLGLTPGRGKALRAIKDNSKDSNEDLTSVSSRSSSPELPAPEPFDPFPPLEITSCYDNTTLPRLISYLEERLKRRRTLLFEFTRKHENIRHSMTTLDQDRGELDKALEMKKTQVSEKEREISNLERRIRSLTNKNENLQKAASEFAREKKTMHEQLGKKQRQIEKERHDKLRLEQDVKGLVSNEKSKWEKVCQKRVRDKELEMEDQILMKAEKLRQLREIVGGYETPNTVAVNIPIEDAPTTSYTPTPKRSKENVGSTTPHFVRVPTTSSAKAGPPVAAKPSRNQITKSATHLRGRSRSPAPSVARKDRNAPIRSRHRRSRSSDYWIEHKPSGTLETDTIMQPQVKKKKTVNNPTVKDLKGVRYLLQHQEEDTDGEIETQLIKGDIMKTRSGGHSVQFTDVELLKKKPTPPSKLSSSGKNDDNTPLSTRGRKRSSQEMDKDADSEDSWTSVETRCAIAIEGKPGSEPAITNSAKRMK